MARKAKLKKAKVQKPPKPTALQIALDADSNFCLSLNNVNRDNIGAFLKVVKKNEKRFARDLNLVSSVLSGPLSSRRDIQSPRICKAMLEELVENVNYQLTNDSVTVLKAYARVWVSVLRSDESEKKALAAKAHSK